MEFRFAPLARHAALLGACSLAGCWVSPPRVEDLLAVGYRTPEQAFRTFQTAVRADEPELEYRCFSQDFRDRNGISKLVWREAREKLRDDFPFLRKGLTDATAVEPVVVRGDRARLRVTAHSHVIEIGLVREDFVEVFAGGELWFDSAVPFEEHTGIQTRADGARWIYGQSALPSGAGAVPEFTELRFGREWKIDSFESTDAPPPPKSSRAEAQATNRDD
jgi:hypothetical protein